MAGRAALGALTAAMIAGCAAGCCRTDSVGRAEPATTPVNAADYQTYHSYGWQGMLFSTAGGVRCLIYDGPHSFQYAASVRCWGPLPGVAAGVNSATVSSAPRPAHPTPVYSFFGHADSGEIAEIESYLDGPARRRPVDPASYRLLAPGQRIVVPGSRQGSAINDAVCAAGPDDVLACEIQHLETDHGNTHGFRLSPQGSHAY